MGLGIHCMVTFDDNERHIHTSYIVLLLQKKRTVQLWLDCGRKERNVFHPFPHQRTISVALFFFGVGWELFLKQFLLRSSLGSLVSSVRLLRLTPVRLCPFDVGCSWKRKKKKMKKHGSIDDGDCLEQKRARYCWWRRPVIMIFLLFVFFSSPSFPSRVWLVNWPFPKGRPSPSAPRSAVGIQESNLGQVLFDFWESNPSHATSRLERLIAELTSSFVHHIN